MKYLYFLICIIFLNTSCKNQRSGNFVSNSDVLNSNQSNGGKDQLNQINFNPNSIQITHHYDSLVDSTFSKYKLSDLDLTTLKQILSDPNPDPEDKADEVCGSISKKCKWCTNSYLIDSKYITYKSTLNMFINPLIQMGMIFSTLFGLDAGVGDQLHVMCSKFRKGIRYECSTVFTSSDYCSPKCERESKY
jgi:hypothetical protein